MIPTDEQLSKLPKWAQDYIGDLSRRRSEAVSALQRHCEGQQVTPFFFDEMVREDAESNSHKFRRIYFGGEYARSVNVEFGGVILRITCRNEHNSPEISVNFETSDRRRGDVMLAPRASNSVAFCLPTRLL